ncbi:MAG: DUF2330 domain-containing protein [Phycisphaerae bacterium]
MTILLMFALLAGLAAADGVILPKETATQPYEGSLAEEAQEAIIFFDGKAEPSAREDVILKISVTGELSEFGWVVPFPAAPDIAKEDPALFAELHEYVQYRQAQLVRKPKGSSGAQAAREAVDSDVPVEVISQKTVGNYDTAVLKENEPGALNDWLKSSGYRTLPDAEDVLSFYRDKGYVFACIKVSDAALEKDRAVELHPLRFTFHTGGEDGVYYPMKMSGLLPEPFDVNLYVFYRAWLNDHLNGYGYAHRGFYLNFRDWDSPRCESNAGKSWSAPSTDPYLQDAAGLIPTVTTVAQKLHPGRRFYLTNIRAEQLEPDSVRAWRDDLWLFPHYTNRKMVPHDARRGGVASAAYPTAPTEEEAEKAMERTSAVGVGMILMIAGLIVLVLFLPLAAVLVWLMLRRRQAEPESAEEPHAPAG